MVEGPNKGGTLGHNNSDPHLTDSNSIMECIERPGIASAPCTMLDAPPVDIGEQRALSVHTFGLFYRLAYMSEGTDHGLCASKDILLRPCNPEQELLRARPVGRGTTTNISI